MNKKKMNLLAIFLLFSTNIFAMQRTRQSISNICKNVYTKYFGQNPSNAAINNCIQNFESRKVNFDPNKPTMFTRHKPKPEDTKYNFDDVSSNLMHPMNPLNPMSPLNPDFWESSDSESSD